MREHGELSCFTHKEPPPDGGGFLLFSKFVLFVFIRDIRVLFDSGRGKNGQDLAWRARNGQKMAENGRTVQSGTVQDSFL
jgi:hypothetical protein